MRITVCCTDTKTAPWIEAMRSLLPDAQVDDWTPGAPQADHAVVWSPPQRFLDEQPRLKGIFNIGAGVDALMKLRLPRDAVVVRLDDAGMSAQMAEFVCHAVIRHFRELDAYERDSAQGKWGFRKPRMRFDFPVGVMGLGVLGQRVAQAVAGFEFPVLGWSRSQREVPGVRCYAGESELSAFLAATRVLVCLLPLTPETANIMNRESLSRLQPGGYVINVARGGHLVDDDLIALIDSGHLAGAALDVFRTEPLPQAHPFWTHPKITVTPHTSARTLRDESISQI
ncbi:MAG: glyoxylate/hydroxypyruvate reductase A, partial [Comamonadaceae bacterium]